MKWSQIRLHLGYWVFFALIIFFLRPLLCPQPKLVAGFHGYFPLYDSNCISEIRVHRSPYCMTLAVEIESQDLLTNTFDNVQLGVELFYEGVLVQKNVVDKYDFKVSHSFDKTYFTTLRMDLSYPSKFSRDVDDSELISVRDDILYRISVLSPSERYNCRTTSLRSIMLY